MSQIKYYIITLTCQVNDNNDALNVYCYSLFLCVSAISILLYMHQHLVSLIFLSTFPKNVSVTSVRYFDSDMGSMKVRKSEMETVSLDVQYFS